MKKQKDNSSIFTTTVVDLFDTVVNSEISFEELCALRDLIVLLVSKIAVRFKH